MITDQDIKTTQAYFSQLHEGEAVAQKTFFHLLRRDDCGDIEELAKRCGFEIPEGYRLSYGRGSWHLVEDWQQARTS